MAEKSKESVITSPEDLMYEGTGQRTPTYDEILDALKFTMEMSPAGDVKNLYEGSKKMGISPSIEAFAQMGEGLVPLAMMATGPVGYGLTKGVMKGGKKISNEVLKELKIEKFDELADLQRGKPERSMLKIQDKMPGGVLPFSVEHVGDLTHRMSQKFDLLEGQRENVLGKVNNVLRVLESPYGFIKEHNENITNWYKYFKETDPNFKLTKNEYKEELNSLLKEYTNTHKELPVYNRPQWLAREAAVSLGNQNFKRATKLLNNLKDIASDEKRYKDALIFNPNKKFQEGGPVDLEKYRQLKKINEWQKSQGLKSIDMSDFEKAQANNEVKTPSPSGLSSILRKLGSRIPAVALLGLLSDTIPSKEQFEENLKKLKE